MTHHTRQSALGLPYIVEKAYDGEHYQVSEYTMSEIIASVYEAMETTGKKRGILFLDEINCISKHWPHPCFNSYSTRPSDDIRYQKTGSL